MERINGIKETALAALAAAGSVLANLLGGWDAALQVLVGLMAADYVTGVVVAGIFRRSPKSEGGALESRAGFKGLMRKGGILVLVLASAWLDKLLGAAYVRTAVCLFFVANEGLSILENLGRMGVPLPGFLQNMLEALRERGNRAGGNGEE